MNPALNKSSAIQCFECGEANEIYDGIIFDFYTGLSRSEDTRQNIVGERSEVLE